ARQAAQGLQEMVRDGNDTNGRPKYIDEADYAVGKSFDLDGLKPEVFSLADLTHPTTRDFGANVVESETGNKPTGIFSQVGARFRAWIAETGKERVTQPP